ncbi:hypothetical protein EIP91_001360 [Steccherinum ochraceum]|uniref:Uncharacterized protein n=1 Tax=Steccherinum ochraceum TaxID=92696 RepID=A0A4R0RUR3_9APHY|nr:hypothetical protein EIP91_001360 [Steccherinum ochraceum]
MTSSDEGPPSKRMRLDQENLSGTSPTVLSQQPVASPTAAQPASSRSEDSIYGSDPEHHEDHRLCLSIAQTYSQDQRKEHKEVLHRIPATDTGSRYALMSNVLLSLAFTTVRFLNKSYARVGETFNPVLLATHPSLEHRVERMISGEDEADREDALIKVIHFICKVLRGEPQNLPAEWVDDAEATKAAWSGTFIGIFHQLLLLTINEANASRDKSEVYNNVISIIQSSGTGKTRMCYEASNHVFTIHISLRNKASSRQKPDGDNGYPQGDISLYEYFRSTGEKEVVSAVLREKYAAFLASLFAEVHQRVLELPNLQESHSRESFAEQWQAHIREGSNRATLYNKVVENLKPNENGEYKYPLKKAMDTAREEGANLVALIRSRSRIPVVDKDVVVMICIDEADALIANRADKRSVPYDSLCAALNAITTLDIFTVFLSTSSNLGVFIPQRGHYTSERVRNARKGPLHAPVVELPWDIWRGPNNEPISTEGTLTLKDVCKASFMVRFGRPLFWTRYQYGGLTVQNDIVNFAMQKLSGSPDGTQPLDELAALAVRVIIEFEQTRRDTFPSVEDRLVQGSGRLVLSVPQHREYMRTGYGSEPIIAEAAARIMREPIKPDGLFKDASYWARVINNTLASGTFNKGPNGELAMRLLLTCAYDEAVKMENTSYDPIIQCDRPVKLINFLIALLGPLNAEKVLNSLPSNQHRLSPQARLSLRERFQDAKVRFTHFMRAGSPEIVKDQSMWPALVRGFAYQCCDGQKDIDIIIPILLDGDEVLDASTVSPLVFQIKNTIQAANPYVDIASTRPDGINFFSKEDGRPYIAVTANLGVTKSEVIPAPHGERDSSRTLDQHARYAFTVNGSDASSYPGITDVAPWDILLNKGKLFDEHPHGGERLMCAQKAVAPVQDYGCIRPPVSSTSSDALLDVSESSYDADEDTDSPGGLGTPDLLSPGCSPELHYPVATPQHLRHTRTGRSCNIFSPPTARRECPARTEYFDGAEDSPAESSNTLETPDNSMSMLTTQAPPPVIFTFDDDDDPSEVDLETGLGVRLGDAPSRNSSLFLGSSGSIFSALGGGGGDKLSPSKQSLLSPTPSITVSRPTSPGRARSEQTTLPMAIQDIGGRARPGENGSYTLECASYAATYSGSPDADLRLEAFHHYNFSPYPSPSAFDSPFAGPASPPIESFGTTHVHASETRRPANPGLRPLRLPKELATRQLEAAQISPQDTFCPRPLVLPQQVARRSLDVDDVADVTSALLDHDSPIASYGSTNKLAVQEHSTSQADLIDWDAVESSAVIMPCYASFPALSSISGDYLDAGVCV